MDPSIYMYSFSAVMESHCDENPRGKIYDILDKFDSPHLQFVQRHMLTFDQLAVYMLDPVL